MHLYTTAAIAGVACWAALHRRPIRGHAAAAMHVAAFLALYLSSWFIHAGSGRILGTTAFAACIYSASALFTTALYRLSPWHPLSAFPGPWTWRVTNLCLAYVSFGGRRYLILDELHARYGPFVRIGPNTLSINCPEGQQLYSFAAQLPKSEAYRAPGRENQVAMFFKSPTEKMHSERKRLWAKLFSKEGVVPLFQLLETRTEELLSCIERRQSESLTGYVNLTDCFNYFAYDFMGDMVFGGANSADMMNNGDPSKVIMGGKKAVALLDSLGQVPWLFDIIWHLPISSTVHNLEKLAIEMTHKRIESKERVQYRDLLSYLTESGDIPLEDLELESVTAMLAGSDNTAAILTLAIFFLAAQPQYLQRLRDELKQHSIRVDEPLDRNGLGKVAFLDAVINETLRLGTMFFLPRVVQEGGIRVSETLVPEGTTIALAAYSQHVSPDNFSPEPLNFRPERWFPDGLGPGTKTDKSAIFAFSLGPSACIAKTFTFQQVRYVLAKLVLSMNIIPAKDFSPDAFRRGMRHSRTMFLQEPLAVKVSRR